MKTIKSLILLLLIISVTQATNFNDYFNLRKGNIFVYSCFNSELGYPFYWTVTHRLKITITDTISHSGKTYYTFTKQLIKISNNGYASFMTFDFPFYAGNGTAVRIDSINGMVYCYNTGSPCSYSPNETMIDSLNSKLADIVNIYCVSNPYFVNCIDTAGRRKYKNPGGNLGIIEREYEYGVGYIHNYQYFQESGVTRLKEQTLIGRVINGVVYGDTAMPIVGIINPISEIPAEFSLHQNYPNPFNPSTKIKFDTPPQPSPKGREQWVRLVIYDILGREITTLVNERLKPGTYEVEWDGSNSTSGVYFYKLVTSDYIETKKMVLVK